MNGLGLSVMYQSITEASMISPRRFRASEEISSSRFMLLGVPLSSRLYGLKSGSRFDANRVRVTLPLHEMPTNHCAEARVDRHCRAIYQNEIDRGVHRAVKCVGRRRKCRGRQSAHGRQNCRKG